MLVLGCNRAVPEGIRNNLQRRQAHSLRRICQAGGRTVVAMVRAPGLGGEGAEGVPVGVSDYQQARQLVRIRLGRVRRLHAAPQQRP
eukprot:1191108-Prorocentrum_minimum.AAC.2